MNFSKKIRISIIISVISVVQVSAQDTYLLNFPKLQQWAPPKEKEVELPATEIKKIHIVKQGGRHVCIEECEIPLIDPSKNQDSLQPLNTATATYNSSSEPPTDHVAPKVIFVSASVLNQGDKKFSKIILHSEGSRSEVWSSMDFMLMEGIYSYMAEGVEYLGHFSFSEDSSQTAEEAGCPINHPKLNKENAKFLPLANSQKNTPSHTAIKGLHALYNHEKAFLTQANAIRQNNKMLEANWLAENPPTSKDIRIQFWKNDPKSK